MKLINNKRFIQFIILYFLLTTTNSLKAKCNFQSAKYIDELNDNNSIKSISIKVKNSRKFYKNLLKILTTKSRNIPPKFRKKHKADLLVNYHFGNCEYKAKIWQNGDWKDHIKLKDGFPFGSLNIKLENGNILNAVKFKLLLPETRNHLNEILGISILNSFDFITPKTFEVNTTISNAKSIMLFQEDSQKELLERNLRREGPIFEGDESFLWSNSTNKTMTDFPSLSKII